MKISTKGRYALRVMLDLAAHNDGRFIPLRDVAQRQDITVKYVEQIISPLQKAGFLKSSRGAGGGYRLARDPGQCAVGELLRVMEGDLSVVACLEEQVNECPRSGDCLTLPFWVGLNGVVNEYLDGTTLEDLLKNEAPA